jgi:hypothetical protein
MRVWLIAVLGIAIPAFAMAETGSRPVVGELFTSEGCSSCPPADAKIVSLTRSRPDLLLLTFHVTYWNNLGWHDPFSFAAATERQRHYVALGISPEVYTPALVIDGRQDVVGSDGAAVDAALFRATLNETAAQVDILQEGDRLTVNVGAGTGQGTVLLIGYDRFHQTHVGRGENSGRTLLEANIVRSMSTIGTWSGQPLRLQASIPEGQAIAVLLQADNGHIIGAGRLRADG